MRMRSAWFIRGPATLGFIGILLFGSLHAPCAMAQPGVNPPSAALLKRLAEAVDGHRTGARVWLVAALRPPFDVVGIFEEEGPARARARADSALGSFGPYQTDRDPGLRASFFAKCIHLYSAMRGDYCPGTPLLALADIDSVALVIRMKNGVRHIIPVPTEADAMFFTLSAIDKFAIPYYARVTGLAEAELLRRRLVDVLSRP
jgi:hypothetical protein